MAPAPKGNLFRNAEAEIGRVAEQAKGGKLFGKKQPEHDEVVIRNNFMPKIASINDRLIESFEKAERIKVLTFFADDKKFTVYKTPDCKTEGYMTISEGVWDNMNIKSVAIIQAGKDKPVHLEGKEAQKAANAILQAERTKVHGGFTFNGLPPGDMTWLLNMEL